MTSCRINATQSFRFWPPKHIMRCCLKIFISYLLRYEHDTSVFKTLAIFYPFPPFLARTIGLFYKLLQGQGKLYSFLRYLSSYTDILALFWRFSPNIWFLKPGIVKGNSAFIFLRWEKNKLTRFDGSLQSKWFIEENCVSWLITALVILHLRGWNT